MKLISMCCLLVVLPAIAIAKYGFQIKGSINIDSGKIMLMPARLA
jgi:hypothetical protein